MASWQLVREVLHVCRLIGRLLYPDLQGLHGSARTLLQGLIVWGFVFRLLGCFRGSVGEVGLTILVY